MGFYEPSVACLTLRVKRSSSYSSSSDKHVNRKKVSGGQYIRVKVLKNRLLILAFFPPLLELESICPCPNLEIKKR